jgi:protein-S-isoprenylcysteine O-methyltransferase Ste14
MTSQFKLIVFIFVSVGIAWVSRASLFNFRSHGFYRVFAWEAIVIMILLNLNYWFYVPFSIQQMISWLFLIVSVFLMLLGAFFLNSVGKPNRRRNDPALIGIEKTTALVTVGIYRWIRHPVYSSLLFLAWGVFFKHPSWVGVFLTFIVTFFVIMTAKMEEIENLRFFGAAYQSYMKQTKMFVPFLL